MQEALAALALIVVLFVAVRRPRGLSEGVVAVPVAGVLVAAGAVSWDQARHEIELVGPVVGFLAAVLALAEASDGEGVFRVAGQRLARAANGSASALLVGVAVLAAVATAVLSLDTTVVLVTPVVIALGAATGISARPQLYLTGHLANSASLLLPVSNLTNLLAVATVSLSFPRFAALMVLPWLLVIGVEVFAARRLFAADLRRPAAPVAAPVEGMPVFAVVILVLTVGAFAVSSLVDLEPVWFAAAGAAALALRRLVAGRTTVRRVVGSTAPSFCLFVLALAVVVRALSDHGLGDVVRDVVPAGSGLLPLLAIAGLGALLANLVNNLPATLLLLPVAAAGGVGPALAVLVGVNIGPNLTYSGSLATLLWRRGTAAVPGVPTVREFTRYGVATVPVAIVLATVALWGALKVVGTGH